MFRSASVVCVKHQHWCYLMSLWNSAFLLLVSPSFTWLINKQFGELKNVITVRFSAARHDECVVPPSSSVSNIIIIPKKFVLEVTIILLITLSKQWTVAFELQKNVTEHEYHRPVIFPQKLFSLYLVKKGEKKSNFRTLKLRTRLKKYI